MSTDAPRPADEAAPAGWTFLSNHAHVILCIAREPAIRLRDVAAAVGITERAVQRIVAELEQGGYLTRVRAGRRNHYVVHAHRPLRHPIEAHRDVRALLALVLSPAEMRALEVADEPIDGARGGAAEPPDPGRAGATRAGAEGAG